MQRSHCENIIVCFNELVTLHNRHDPSDLQYAELQTFTSTYAAFTTQVHYQVPNEKLI